MPTINGKACVANGTPVDKVFSNGVQVYGRNLLKGTAKFDFRFTNTVITQTMHNYDNETNYIQYTCNTPTNTVGLYWALPPEVGQVYTLSADVCGNGYTHGGIFHYVNAENSSLGRVDLTDNWQRISNTFRINMISDGWLIYANNSTLLKIKRIKIEKDGNTPYSLAPEDVM